MKAVSLVALAVLALSSVLLVGCADDSGAGPIKSTKAPSTPPDQGAQNGAPPKTNRVSIPGAQQGKGG
ncbi:MAG: hypothetical protein ABUL49_00575 [bacterium]